VSQEGRPPATAAAFYSVLAFVLLTVIVVEGMTGILRSPVDFTAFRCGGLVTVGGGDPYHVEPLRACELATLATAGRHLPPHLVVPAPLPPYALLPFAAFGTSHSPIPGTIWALLLVLEFAVTCVLLVPMVRGPALLVVASLLAADLLASLLVGQLTPLEIAFITLAAVALTRRRFILAGFAASASLLVPHIGITVMLAMALWERRTRFALAIGLVALGTLSLIPHGAGLDIEYLTGIIPAQAFAEGLNSALQFGLSGQLALAGFPAEAAIALGTASYIVMVALGMWIGRKLARTYENAAFALFTPAAFSLIGGVYAHIHQIAVALPLALMLVGRGVRTRKTLLIAVMLLSIPWQTLGEIVTYRPVPPAALVRSEHLMDLVDDDTSLAAGVWGVWVKTGEPIGHSVAFSLAEKIPTWVGLFALLFVSLDAALQRPKRVGAPRASPERVRTEAVSKPI
jgi:hypothetical protein